MPSRGTYLVPVSPSYAQPRNIPVSPSQVQPQTIPSSIFILISPTEEHTRFKIVVRAHVHRVMAHLRLIHDVDIHPHHLHVHTTRPFTTTGCSPCFPPLRVTRLLLPPTEGSLDEGRGSQACTSLPSRTVFCLSQLVYLTCDYLVPKHKQAQAKPLKITVPDYKY